ncbi:hypothetical protein E4U41_007061 [Claviceps citrina]|nr:hypothetical protein E4U41_007061 [Claviceps citrina]
MAHHTHFPPKSCVRTLGQDHYQAFERALRNVLSTELAEFTMAQLVDGLPTIDVLIECRGLRNMRDHPIYNHRALCEGALERTREFRSKFDPSLLLLKSSSIKSFQDCPPDSRAFDLRLLELLAEAVHSIAVSLFELKEKSHVGDIQSVTSFREAPYRFQVMGKWIDVHNKLEPHHTLFTTQYNCLEQYPNGVADVAAYWAEDRIFGGVLLFDRGRSGEEASFMCAVGWEHSNLITNVSSQCNNVYLHSNRREWSMRVWSLLDTQFKHLMEFLKGDSGSVASPFPLCADEDNAHRFDDWDAMMRHNIYRDRWERVVPEEKNWDAVRRNVFDYPELRDWFRVFNGVPRQPI